MNSIEPLTLIEGEFSAEEAKEILINAFSAKVKFHEMKNFSTFLRFGKDNETALKRIAELKETIEQIRKVIDEAEANNQQLKITSAINITLTDDLTQSIKDEK